MVLFGEFLSNVGSGATFPYLVVYLHDVCGLSGGQVGAVLVVRALAAVVGAVLGGVLSDRYGAGRTVVGIAAVAAAAAAVMAGAHGSIVLPAVVAAVMGTGAGAALVPALDALLARSVPESAREKAFSWRNTVVTTGAMLGVAGAAGTLGLFGVDAGLHWVYALDAASFVVLMVLVGRATRRHGNGSAGAAARSAAEGLRARNSREPSGKGYAAVARDPAMRGVFVFVFFVVAAGFAQLQIGLPAVSVLTHDVAGLGWVFTANMLVVALAQVPAQRMLARFPRPAVLAGGAAFMAGAWAIIALDSTPGTGRLLVAAVVFALGEVAYMPVVAALVNDLAPPGLTGRYNGAHTLAWTSGFAIGAGATGTLLGADSIRLFFTVSAAVLGASALVALRLAHILPKRHADDRS
ncbi:MFS transporter [Streptomyces aureus]|uniref:MFS transporter n=1 Tax=Streptomyces aureus TaxID=193461 RepID=UPI000A4CDCB2|nr:MFS transporter [Streptomyces aureus]